MHSKTYQELHHFVIISEHFFSKSADLQSVCLDCSLASKVAEKDWPPLDKSNSFSGCLSDRGAQPLAELNLAERSEAPARSAVPREARPAPKAPGAEGAPELREGFKRKLECDPTGSIFCCGV